MGQEGNAQSTPFARVNFNVNWNLKEFCFQSGPQTFIYSFLERIQQSLAQCFALFASEAVALRWKQIIDDVSSIGVSYEGWFPPILTFKFCYAILLCCYAVFLGILTCMFESYYSLSNFVIYFSDFIMPLCILFFSFEFCYSVSNYVMQLSNSIIRLYSSLMQFRILFFSFRILLFTFSILLCQYQFCYSVSNSWLALSRNEK